MLTNKYLKYNSSITFEIFQLVWHKLIANGWKATCDFVSVRDRFQEFKNGEMLYNDNPNRKTFYINYKDVKKYMEDSNHILIETTVQEILGDIISEPIKEWSIDTYVVFLKDYGGHPKGTVDKIITDNNSTNVKVSLPFNGSDHCNLSKDSEAKWFATKFEADEFAKTIIEESIKESVKESVKFVVGNWYQYNSSVYLKFNGSIGGRFISSERIVDCIYSKVQSSYDATRCTEISIEVIQKHLPVGHPDKFISKTACKFVVGKWYKGSENYYMKFLRIDDSEGYNKLYHSENINHGKYTVREDYWANDDFESRALRYPLDLKEIQQYLPDGHVDKIEIKTFNGFKVGDWLVLGGDDYAGYSEGDLFQIWSLGPDSFSAKEKNSNEINNGFSYNMNRLATPEEIKKQSVNKGSFIEKAIAFVTSDPDPVKQYFPIITEIIE